MRRKLNLLICAALILLSNGVAGIAQKKFCPAPPPSPFKHSGQIVTSFDSSAKGMRTTLEHPRPLSIPQGELYLSASFVHVDPRRPIQPSVEFVLVAASKAQRFRAVHDVTLLSDGRPVTLSAPARYQTGTDEQGFTLEILRVTLSREELASLTSARKVTGRIGSETFELTKNHLEALRELASLMAGPQTRWRAE